MDGELKIVGVQPVAGAEPLTGPATLLRWRWYYHAPTVALWALILLLLVAPKANRHRQAWLIFVPLGVVLLLWSMFVRLLSMPSDPQQRFGFVVVTAAMAWAAVWLLGHWLGRRSRFLTFLGMWLVMDAVGAASYFCHYGGGLDELAPMLITYGVFIVFPALGTTLAGFSCRKRFSPGRFLAWLLMWTVVPCMLLPLLWMSLILFAAGPPPGQLPMIALMLTVSSAVLGGLVYLWNLPFLVLAFKCPFYGERLRKMLGLGSEACREAGQELPEGLATTSTEPTRQPVTAEDLVGPWQYYLAGACRLVSLDFRPDGTFAQTFVHNRDGVQQCPGGTWRLEGPMIHLEGYQSAARGGVVSATWWMMDTASGLAPCGGDDPDATPGFRLWRVRPPYPVEEEAKSQPSGA